MRKLSALCLTLLLGVFYNGISAQDQKPFTINKHTFVAFIKETLFNKNLPLFDNKIIFPVSATESYPITVNWKDLSGDSISIRGNITSHVNSNFYLDFDGKVLSGALLIGEKKAYRFSSDSIDQFNISVEDINKLICVENPKVAESPNTEDDLESAEAEGDEDVLKLESLPGSPYVIYLDFNGHNLSFGTRWNSGTPFNAEPSNFSDNRIREAWDLVSEDYKPFNLNITTNEDVFNNARAGRRMRVVITPTSTAAPNSGGVAYIGSFSLRSREEPCFVFNLGSAKICGETISHEVGHTLNLQHDGDDDSDYYSGHSGWAPIMGSVTSSRRMGHFSRGEYTRANNTEDDLQILATRNGFTYRQDEVGNRLQDAAGLILKDSGSISSDNQGIIETNTDIDFYRFTTIGGKIDIMINPAVRHGNLKVEGKIHDVNGKEILSNVGENLECPITTSLSPGTYYLSIEGTGSGDPVRTGYSKYGSIGTYAITGYIPTAQHSITSVLEHSTMNNQAIYPNPFKDVFSVELDGAFEYSIIGIDGKTVANGKGENKLTEGNDLMPGIYMLKLENLYGSKVIRIVKQ